MEEEKRSSVGKLLNGIDRYNPENLSALEDYVHQQVHDNFYDLDANLAVLKLYQFNPAYSQTTITSQILLKALMNLPNSDFIMCRCVIDDSIQQDPTIQKVITLADLLETCSFAEAWRFVDMEAALTEGITGFHEAIRLYVSYVIGITYQNIDADLASELLGGVQGNDLQEWSKKMGWKFNVDGSIFIANQEAHIKSRNIAEKIDFDSVASIIASAR
ncbi:eukaryotic translation initiation factor 3 subunit K-like [Actinia tenebrosa]|uniref:Eukaryotic translation initiation factor 3 subunit K n=1 Tax=Actinia tenebrosa TaxID=6105 RepID=A0A6P8HDM7_ACTTE|nr:eukaryotic translation initiation factor 3 subunit K-like [Actinia tenebrosa]